MELMLTMDKSKARLGLYEKAMPSTLSWEEKLTFAKQANYDWIEISIDATEEKISRVYWTKEEREELVALMQKTGIRCDTMNISALTKYALGSNHIETVTKGMDIAINGIDLACDLGVRLIQIPGYDVYFEPKDEKTHQRYVENLKKVVNHAANRGVMLGLETMEDEYMNTVEKAMKIVNLINSPYLKIYPDIGNITNALLTSSTTLYEDLMKGHGHIAAIHLKETKENVYREVPYGEGHVDFSQAIKAGKEMGISMFLGEFWYVGQPNWKDDCLSSCQFLSKNITDVFK